MAVYMPVNTGIAALRFTLAGDQEEMVTTFGIRLTSDINPPAELAATAVDTAARHTDSIFPSAAAIQVGYTYVGCTTRVMTADGIVVDEVSVPLVGTATGEPPPQNCAVLVQKRTSLGGRRNRGRMFLPPYCLSDTAVNAAGVINSTTVGIVQANLSGFLTQLALEDVSMVILHEATASDPTPSETTVTGLIMQSTIATQRRRLRR